jgi:hypothetical protein
VLDRRHESTFMRDRRSRNGNEEVRKYVDCLKYLKRAFNIENLEPLNLSLFECTTPEFQDAFGFVLFAGVLYICPIQFSDCG